MPALATKDLRAVLDVVYSFNDDQDDVEMPSQVLVRLGGLVGCESVSYNRVEPTSGRLLRVVAEPATGLGDLPGFYAVFHQHPGFAAYRSGQLMVGTSAAWSELADLRTLRRLELYADFYRPARINDHLLCIVELGKQQATVLGFNRARRGFSQRDRAIVELVTPHLAQAIAHRQHLVSLTAALRSWGRHSEQVEQALPRLSVLTARERDIVEHLTDGATDREIARSLAISQRTVHKHLERTYRKLGLGNRASLIALVHRTDARTG